MKLCICEAGDACDLHMASCTTCERPCQGHPQPVEVLYKLQSLGIFPTLREAWTALKARIQQDIESGCLTLLALEEMVHLQPVGNHRPNMVMGFYQARDIASDQGW